MRGRGLHGQVCRLCPAGGCLAQVMSMGELLAVSAPKPCSLAGPGGPDEGSCLQRCHENRSRLAGGIHHCSLVVASPGGFQDIKTTPSGNARKEGLHFQPGVLALSDLGRQKCGGPTSKFYF